MGELDDERVLSGEQQNTLAQSQKRCSEQDQMIRKLEERNEAMRLTLEKTMRKLNEVQNSYTAAKAEHDRSSATSIGRYSEQAPELTRALNRVQTLAAQREQSEAELVGVQSQLDKFLEDLGKERSH